MGTDVVPLFTTSDTFLTESGHWLALNGLCVETNKTAKKGLIRVGSTCVTSGNNLKKQQWTYTKNNDGWGQIKLKSNSKLCVHAPMNIKTNKMGNKGLKLANCLKSGHAKIAAQLFMWDYSTGMIFDQLSA